MREYNGFPSHIRSRAGVFRKRMIYELRIPKTPPACLACGQTEGAMCYHTEDYSEPHGPHTVAFEICYACHMMIHCRHRGRERWIEYCNGVLEGFTYTPIIGWNFKKFCAVYLSRKGLPDPIVIDPETPEPEGLDRRMLIDIDRGKYNPAVNPNAAGYAPEHLRRAILGDVST